ncbi:MAG: hypothetical protein ACRD4Q_04465 [Candidatus Acidiferrales bacterium]
MITDSCGNVCYDADYYPYGGERDITDSCPQNYKFTAKERDSEWNLDNFGARYYCFRLGSVRVARLVGDAGKRALRDFRRSADAEPL